MTRQSNKDATPKIPRLFVTFGFNAGSVLNTSITSQLRQTPLSLDNALPAAVFRFGSSDKNKFVFLLRNYEYYELTTSYVDYDNVSRHCLKL